MWLALEDAFKRFNFDIFNEIFCPYEFLSFVNMTCSKLSCVCLSAAAVGIQTKLLLEAETMGSGGAVNVRTFYYSTVLIFHERSSGENISCFNHGSLGGF